jgi:sortase A
VSVRLVVRGLSEFCITAGALIVLFVVYLLFWTGIKADHASSDQIDQLHHQWSQGAGSAATPAPSLPPSPAASASPAPAPAPVAYKDGKAFAVMYIPRLGKKWSRPVLQDTRVKTLQKGLGHYAGTARLGATGNFAVAGHRRTYGDPFKDFPELRPGDAVVIDDGKTWFTYRIDNKPYLTVPSDVGVVDPVPDASPFKGPGRYLTLTTCDPEWGSSHRLIAWGHLDSTQPAAQGRPDALRS